MHAQVSVATQPQPEPAVRDVRYTAPEDPSQAGDGMAAAAAAQAAAEAAGGGAPPPPPAAEETRQPVVRTEWDKTPRNAPCPCGSGKKFKHCHGR